MTIVVAATSAQAIIEVVTISVVMAMTDVRLSETMMDHDWRIAIDHGVMVQDVIHVIACQPDEIHVTAMDLDPDHAMDSNERHEIDCCPDVTHVNEILANVMHPDVVRATKIMIVEMHRRHRDVTIHSDV